MSYTIYRADGTPVTVPDNAIDTSYYTSNVYGAGIGIGTLLVGRNAINYGAPIAQNFLQIVENFASSAANRPTDAVALQGQLWFEKVSGSAGRLYVRISSSTTGGIANWKEIVVSSSADGTINNRGGTVVVENPGTGLERNGDLLVNSTTDTISARIDGVWKQLQTVDGSGAVDIRGGNAVVESPNPGSEMNGDLLVNTSTGVVSVRVNADWKPIVTLESNGDADVRGGNVVVESPTAGSERNGDLLVDVGTGKISARIGSNWQQLVTVGGSGGTINSRGGTVTVVNPTAGEEVEGDIKVVGGVVSIWDGTAWRQIFPAVYS